MEENLEQYSKYIRFCRYARTNDALFENYSNSETDVTEFPVLDFSRTRAFDAFKMTVKMPVVSPYISSETMADILDISLADYEYIVSGKAVVCFSECLKGRIRTGDMVMRNHLLKNELSSGYFLSTGYAIAFLLYLRDYYRKDEDGDFLIGNENVSDRTKKALKRLEEYNLDATDVFIHDLIGPKELTTVFQTDGIDGSDELRYLANTYYSIYNAIERVNVLQKRNSTYTLIAHSSLVKKRMDDLIANLVGSGMVFKNHFEFDSGN